MSPTQVELQAWQQHRHELVALSESFGVQLDRDARFIIWDYVDHNEQGLAFDHLLYRLFDELVRDIAVTPEQADRLHELGKALGYTANSSIVYKIFLTQHFPDEV